MTWRSYPTSAYCPEWSPPATAPSRTDRHCGLSQNAGSERGYACARRPRPLVHIGRSGASLVTSGRPDTGEREVRTMRPCDEHPWHARRHLCATGEKGGIVRNAYRDRLMTYLDAY